MRLAIFNTGPRLESAKELYWAMNPSLRVGRFAYLLYTPTMTTASFSMVADAFRLLDHSARQCWKNRNISFQTVANLFQAGGLGICAVYCFSVGRFFPGTVVGLRRLLGAPHLGVGFRMHRLFFHHKWDGSQGNVYEALVVNNWLKAATGSMAFGYLSTAAALDVIKAGSMGLAAFTGLGSSALIAMSVVSGVGSIGAAICAVKHVRRQWKELDI